MGKGGYLGGNTIISPGGRGWSNDPLAPVSQGEKRPKPKLISKSHEPDTEWLMNFATSCAACAVLGIGFPPRSVLGERFDKLFDGNREKFHEPFRARIGSLKSKARLLLKAHIDWAAADVQRGKPLSNLPKALQFCLLHPRFNDAIVKEVEIALARKTGHVSGPSALDPRKKKSKQTTK